MKLRLSSAMWAFLYLLVLLSLLTPLSAITLLVMIVPVAVLYASLRVNVFWLHVLPVLAILAVISGTLAPYTLILAAYFLVPGIVMGHLYKKRAPALQTIMYGTGTLLGMLLVLLAGARLLLDFNLSNYVSDFVHDTFDPLLAVAEMNPMLSQQWSPDFIFSLANQTVMMIPLGMTVGSFVLAVVTHSIVRPTLTSMGVAAPKLRPAHEWKLPRALIFYYFVVLIIDMVTFNQGDGFWKAAAVNLLPLLQYCFIVQAIGFWFFIGHVKKWHRAICILMAIVTVVFPPMRIIGIIDLAFPLREFITRPRR
ncbi:DUF2232 domain-containing protein [Saccharibacillus alkalitolerans]|uniref:DUF2232 domain-containing protein n=1 Tax=Saccharibacillus alkalitolerans TaxID=2705290 RepID=A0ABX0FAT1_9BACL|nr:DUF2232 domain-containing protein [Saccharibacillus alkalitolerans]NGZ76589.1 DUF2232 domain-containing protein [Saccharibacillus alkalitolerans]